MLPLVQQITNDIVVAHGTLVRLHPEEEHLDQLRKKLDWPMRSRRYQVKEELAKAEKDLEIAVTELRDLGLVILQEPEGRIGFPTMVNNRRAFFSWRLGDESLHTWRFADEDVDRPIPATWLKEITFANKS
jgi:hypothetical protein